MLPDLILYSLTSPRVLGDPHDRAAADRGRPDPFRLAMLRGGGPPPGLNTAVRAAIRLTLARGYTMLAVRNWFRGLRDGDVREVGWMDVSGWVSSGGAELGTIRFVPGESDVARIADVIASHRVDGLLMAGGEPQVSAVAAGQKLAW